MQFMPYQEPEWQKSLSGLLGNLGNQGARAVDTYYQAKNQRELKKREKAEKETELSRQAEAYSSMLGLSPEQGRALATSPSDIQKTIVQQIIDRGGFRQSGAQGMGMQAPAAPQSPMGALQGLASPQKERVPMGGLTLSNAAQSVRPEDPNSFLAQRVLGGAAAGVKPQQNMQAPQKMVNPAKELESKIDSAVRNYDINQGIDMNPTNISGLLGSGMSKDEAKQAIKDTAEYDKKLKQETHAAKDLVRITKDMTDLVEKDIQSGGKLLRGPATQTLLNAAEGLHGKGTFGGLGGAIGGILGSVIPGIGTLAGAGAGLALGGLGSTLFEAYQKGTATKETQQFEKNSAEFIKGAKGIFGSRITDADLNMFMKMVPTLSNTNDGKLAVLRNIQLVNEAALAKGKVRDRIVKANGGKRPYNLEEMVEEISDPIISDMADQFKKDTEALFEKYNTQQAAPTGKSALPGLPGGYSAEQL